MIKRSIVTVLSLVVILFGVDLPIDQLFHAWQQ